LNIPADTEDQQVETLEHVVTWIDNKTQIHLKWSGMSTYCRYCNKDGHCRADCEELLMTKLCYQCNNRGHLAKHCPRLDSPNEISNQKPITTQQPANKTRFIGRARKGDKSHSKGKGKEHEVVIIKDDDKPNETEDVNKPKVAGIAVDYQEDEQASKPKESGSNETEEYDLAPKDMELVVGDSASPIPQSDQPEKMILSDTNKQLRSARADSESEKERGPNKKPKTNAEFEQQSQQDQQLIDSTNDLRRVHSIMDPNNIIKNHD
jgi:hypothetical protein